MLPPKIRGSNPLLKEKLFASMSMPVATNGAAKKPAAKRMVKVIIDRICIFFSETSMPMNIPSMTKPAVETHLIKMSYSLPRMLKNLRNHIDIKSKRAHMDAHNASLKRINLFTTSIIFICSF